jgi:hypothetical protein
MRVDFSLSQNCTAGIMPLPRGRRLSHSAGDDESYTKPGVHAARDCIAWPASLHSNNAAPEFTVTAWISIFFSF